MDEKRPESLVQIYIKYIDKSEKIICVLIIHQMSEIILFQLINIITMKKMRMNNRLFKPQKMRKLAGYYHNIDALNLLAGY